jgi:peroxiredoxin
MRSVSLLLLFSYSLFAAGELIGHRAPGFSLPDVNFKYHDPQDYRGRILIVEFMQTTCPHCAAFSKILEEVSAKYAGKVAVLSVANPPDTPQTVSQFISTQKISNTVVLDRCLQVAGSYLRWTPKMDPGFNIPRIFVVDGNGIVKLDLEYGPLAKDVFEGRGLFVELDKLLAASGKK